MEQTKALNALEPFLALTKSASSPRAAADLITRATSAPNTFIFAELLLCPQIQALSTSKEYSTHLTLLQIFSYGTYTTYTSTPGLPALNTQQTQKLRQLSFVTLAKNPADLSYSNLTSALGLQNERELEDLVISAIYAGLVVATLDPYHHLVAVSSVSPLRDLPPDSIPAMLSTLSEWSSRCTTTLSDLEKQIASIKAEALRRHRGDAEWDKQMDKLVEGKGTAAAEAEEKEEKGRSGSMFGGLGRKLAASSSAAKRGSQRMDGDHGDDMDLDEEIEENRSLRSTKKRGLGGLGFGR